MFVKHITRFVFLHKDSLRCIRETKNMGNGITDPYRKTNFFITDKIFNFLNVS
jgi:hypothetical protein